MTSVAESLDALANNDWLITDEGPGFARIMGNFSNPERVALTAVGQVADENVLVYADNGRGDWALAGWRRPDSVVLTYAGASVRWRHRRLPATARPDAANFLSGQPSPYDIVTKPKHQPTDAARAILDELGAPTDWLDGLLDDAARAQASARAEAEAERERAKPARPAKPARAPRASAPKRERPPAKPEPVVAVCPRCFMQLSATGECGNCD